MLYSPVRGLVVSNINRSSLNNDRVKHQYMTAIHGRETDAMDVNDIVIHVITQAIRVMTMSSWPRLKNASPDI